ncbi:terminase large subunit domain-containing protein [Tuwongella immobilis]|uniref:Terminase large subunit gp17-like C-terminal domain-containing protein n=1 Tax=Tuwongella immobilis TaxID=692036 RepID=A0A6C2YH62_9BACT|nr:terminase family protein [Tuwongella immobilis]VIP00694.1 Prophage MuMc02, terminase, ATPase subunit, putative OS=Rhizobium etli CNPAF512 GN=RHECNPAF_31009 PE=4 SV=1: Terminase_6 [Tuwongella immobilis]VTR96806.1 Prophage MuMc02, terminase, ATPase subunit, putative OS=Rhizobium etli CNPAF512 GN=RHECNPAF_31009 PE=4 SV=1: Terminase_6 [Tuwongella immobilis]
MTVDTLALACDPCEILRAQGMQPDPWQQRFLLDESRYTLLCCSRGAGKSRCASAKALHYALFRPRSTVLVTSRTQRQSEELFRYILQGYAAVERPVPAIQQTQSLLELANGSRILALPGTEETIRAYQGVQLLLIDEAARVSDSLYRSVRPMLGVSRGAMIAISTPFGQRGWFWQAWSDAAAHWQRIRIPWNDCPRLTPEFIDAERRACGDAWIRQEYECSFESQTGLVFPEMVTRCAIDPVPQFVPATLGGIDFGYRNPFAAIWGHRDGDDVLWITGERYASEQSIHTHAAALCGPSLQGVLWYADPAAPESIDALRRAGFRIRKGNNAIAAGIAAVRARIETGRLKIDRSACPNLLAESQRYHYDPEQPGENPVDADNHALAALRYLVSRLDVDFVRHYLRQHPPHSDADAPAHADAVADAARSFPNDQEDLPESAQPQHATEPGPLPTTMPTSTPDHPTRFQQPPPFENDDHWHPL